MANPKKMTSFENMVKDLKNLQFYQRRRVWKPYMEKYNCDIICEIGVRRGENFELMIQHIPKHAVAVDIWRNDGVVAHNDGGFSQDELEKQFINFKNNMADKPFVQILRDYSYNAVKHFRDEYFDFIYIDADHSYEGCLKDIKDWYPKVKKGGVLLGDDYRLGKTKTGVKFGVIKAVNDYTSENNLDFFELPKRGWGIIKK